MSELYLPAGAAAAGPYDLEITPSLRRLGLLQPAGDHPRRRRGARILLCG